MRWFKFISVITVVSFVFALAPTVVRATPITNTFASTASDGFIYKSDTVYNTALVATSGTVDDTSTSAIVGQTFNSPNYQINRAFLFFDTTSIPAYATITAATVNLYCSDNSPSPDFDVVVTSGTVTSYPHNPLVTSDYNRNLYNATNGGSINTSAIGGVAAWHTIVLNTIGLNYIRGGVISKVALISSLDMSGTAPADNSTYVSISTFESAFPPTIDVTYTISQITTLAPTDITATSALFQGVLNDMNGAFTPTVSFEYGTTTSYGLTCGAKTLTSTGYFSFNQMGLIQNTTYHYRARVDYTGSGTYTVGDDQSFSTAPANGSTRTLVLVKVGVFSGYIAPSTGMTITNGTGTMAGSPVSLIVGDQTPTVTIAGTFTVVVPSGTVAVITSGGWTVTGSPVELTANGSFTVQAGGSGTINVKFATDMLIVVENYCFYTFYYPNQMPGDFFQVRLYDTDLTTLLAASPIQNWGDRPASIYLNSSVAKNLTIGAAYGVQLYAYNILTHPRAPATPLVLPNSAWYGTDLVYLDNFCRAMALNMGVTDNKTDYTAILSNGQTVIDAATGYFVSGIPDIATIRPNLFTTSELKVVFPSTADMNTWDNPTAWQANVGTNLTNDLTAIGAPLGVGGREMAVGLIWLVILAVVGMTVANGSKPLGALLICTPIIWLGTYFKIIPIQQLMIMCIILGTFAIRQFIVKTT